MRWGHSVGCKAFAQVVLPTCQGVVEICNRVAILPAFPLTDKAPAQQRSSFLHPLPVEAVVTKETLAVAPIVAWVPSMVLVLLLAAAGASVASVFAPRTGTPRPRRAAGPVAEGAEPEAGAASSSGGDGCTSGLVLASRSGSGTPSGSAMQAVGPDGVQLQQAQQQGDAGQQRPQEGSVSEPAGGGGKTVWSTESSAGAAKGGGAGGGGGGAGDSAVGLAGEGVEVEGQVWVRELR